MSLLTAVRSYLQRAPTQREFLQNSEFEMNCTDHWASHLGHPALYSLGGSIFTRFAFVPPPCYWRSEVVTRCPCLSLQLGIPDHIWLDFGMKGTDPFGRLLSYGICCGVSHPWLVPLKPNEDHMPRLDCPSVSAEPCIRARNRETPSCFSGL